MHTPKSLMRFLTTFATAPLLLSLMAVLGIALSLPTDARAETGYTFADWAAHQGYNAGAVMPNMMDAYDAIPAITSLAGIGGYDWTTTPTDMLNLTNNEISSIEVGTFSGMTNLGLLSLSQNQISSIEPGTFNGLANLTGLDMFGNQISSIESGTFSGITKTNLYHLDLHANQISSIESGAFSGMTNLGLLLLGDNPSLTKLNLEETGFSGLRYFSVGGNTSMTSVSLKNAVLNQLSLETLLDGGLAQPYQIGIGELAGITELDLSGVDFSLITDLSPLGMLDDLTDLRLVGASNIDALGLDAMLDELATMEGAATEGVLYLTQADYDAFNIAGSGLLATWNGEDGHHVEIIPEPASLFVMLAAGLPALLRSRRRRN